MPRAATVEGHERVWIKKARRSGRAFLKGCSASDGIGLLRGLLGLARLLSLVLLLILRLFPLLVLLLIGILIVGVVHAECSEVEACQDWLALINKRRGQ